MSSRHATRPGGYGRDVTGAGLLPPRYEQFLNHLAAYAGPSHRYRQDDGAAVYREIMTAEPVPEMDPLDPRQILAELPEREHASFLAVYREAMDLASRDPSEWAYLLRVLRAWRFHAGAMREPGYREAREAAHRPVNGGMLLDDYLAMRRGA